MKKHVVELTVEERRGLRQFVRAGKAAAQRIRNANILLNADQAEGGPAATDAELARTFSCCTKTVEAVRKRFVLEGVDAATDRKREGVGRPRKIDGDAEAQITRIACSEPPEGHSRWTLQLIADKLVELKIIESCSRMTVQRAMKKTS